MKKLFALVALTLGLLVVGCGGGGSGAAAPSGPTALQVTDTTIGTGTVAAAGNLVTVHYSGWLYDAAAANFRGALFDSSVGKSPFQFKLGAGQVISGWDQGVAGMRVGGTRTLIIPSSMGYGATGVPGVIPPNATLVFNVEVLAVQ
jgi:FKBP-type peptidyl-prolyl cis-trans isomerase FkpA